MNLKVTFLGTGTSQGVPVIACDCKVCKSSDSKDKRLRSSVLFTVDGENYVIDSGPDFRQQMLREKIQSLKALLFTHEYKDHIAGMDDIRAFNFKDKRDMDVYCSLAVEEALRREFHYVFVDYNYGGVPKVKLNRIENKSFNLNGIVINPIQVMHYKMPVFGFRIGNFTYITDAKTVSPEEREKIRGSEVLVINGLRREEHIAHFNLKEALAFIEDVKPEKTYLTHISHLFDTHEAIEAELPANVFVAYDGMTIDLES